MLALFTAAIFLGALLLFLVQPMAARIVLPSLGGSPAVWNTCMVFFQAALLAGYAYAHWGTRALGPRRLAVVHIAVVLLPLLVLWSGAGPGPPPGPNESPVVWLLLTLMVTVGLPFFVLSTGAPLLQRWFAATGHRSSGDPYFLYAASNAGSLLALVAYPLIVEPMLALEWQRRAWSIAYVGFMAVTVVCAIVTLRRADGVPEPAAGDPPSAGTRLMWIAMAFVPSSLLLGVTQHLSTDVAAVPLLWVVPLAIYLLTFILAFARRQVLPLASVSKILPIVIIGLAVAMLVDAKRPVWILFVLHLLTFFLAALVCHGRMAASRPPPARLTEFYLLIAFGGVLGGAFNALAAPLIFDSIAEYPVALAAACLFRLPLKEAADRRRGLLIDAAFAAAFASALFVAGRGLVRLRPTITDDQGVITGLGFYFVDVALVLMVAIPTFLCFLMMRRPLRFALGMAALLFLGRPPGPAGGAPMLVERSFFGVSRVMHNPMVGTVSLIHGTTMHGEQFTDPAKRSIPLGYYHPLGPIGRVFEVFGESEGFDRVGLVGLGSGALASYSRPGQRFTFYEIDPLVVRIAHDPKLFTYLSDAGGQIDVVVGDGRVSLNNAATDGVYGLLVVDAFSSDAIPVHMITREAVTLYMRKLRPGGLLAMHVSNQYLDLAPVLGRIAADLSLAAIHREDSDPPDVRTSRRLGCHWVLIARRNSDFGDLRLDEDWSPIESRPDDPLWTDDYSNIFDVFEWEFGGATP